MTASHRWNSQIPMTPFLRSALHLGVNGMAVLARIWERIERILCSKATLAQRSAERFEALRRREFEVERLDRLRNPSDYQGR